MVAVVPSTPRHQAPQGARSPKPAAGGADFGRLLQEASGEQPTAPEEARPAKGAEPAPAPEERAPESKPAQDHADPADTQTAPSPEEGEPAPTEPPGPEPSDDEDQPRTAMAQDSAPVPAAPQPFVPLEAAAFSAAAAQDSLPAETAPAPAAKPLKGLTPAGTQRTPRQTENEESGPWLSDQPAEEQPLDLDHLLPQAPPHTGGQRSSADLLSFDELMRPDLKVEVSPEPVLDQLQQAMNTALLDESAQLLMPQVVRGLATLVSGGMSEMRLQLMPEDLGEIELRVRAGEGVVRGEMMVQNPEVKQLLDQHLDRLRSALHQQGLDLRGFDIGLAPDGRFGQPDRSWQGSRPQGGPRPREAVDAAPEAPALAPRGALAVDYLA